MTLAIFGALILAAVFGFVGGVHWSLAKRDLIEQANREAFDGRYDDEVTP